jgi:hypothetical protein
MLTRERIESRAALRPLKQPLFDTGLILTAGVQRVQFFQAPIGGALGAGIKTEADSNLSQSGQIGRPNEHDLHSFKLELQVVGDDGINTVRDLSLIYDTSVFEFFFGQQRPWLQVPAQEIPNGAGIEGTLSTQNAAGTFDYFLGHCGEGSCKAMYNFTIGKKPIPIGSAEAFSALLSWPLGAINPAGAADIRATCYMVGIFYSAL